MIIMWILREVVMFSYSCVEKEYPRGSRHCKKLFPAAPRYSGCACCIVFQSCDLRFYWSSLFWQTDRAVMLDEILDYVKFLRLQVKVKELLIRFFACVWWFLHSIQIMKGSETTSIILSSSSVIQFYIIEAAIFIFLLFCWTRFWAWVGRVLLEQQHNSSR